MSNNLYKPLVGAALVAAGDNMILQNRNFNSSLALGAAAGVAFYIAPNVVKMLPSQKSGNNSMYDAKTLEERLIEIVLAGGGGYALNRFALNNDLRPNDIAQKLALILGADVISEYFNEYMTGKPLSFLK